MLKFSTVTNTYLNDNSGIVICVISVKENLFFLGFIFFVPKNRHLSTLVSFFWFCLNWYKKSISCQKFMFEWHTPIKRTNSHQWYDVECEVPVNITAKSQYICQFVICARIVCHMRCLTTFIRLSGCDVCICAEKPPKIISITRSIQFMCHLFRWGRFHSHVFFWFILSKIIFFLFVGRFISVTLRYFNPMAQCLFLVITLFAFLRSIYSCWTLVFMWIKMRMCICRFSHGFGFAYFRTQ